MGSLLIQLCNKRNYLLFPAVHSRPERTTLCIRIKVADLLSQAQDYVAYLLISKLTFVRAAYFEV